jgi:hypothetical protein
MSPANDPPHKVSSSTCNRGKIILSTQCTRKTYPTGNNFLTPRIMIGFWLLVQVCRKALLLVDPYCSSFICHLLVYQLTIYVSTYAIFEQELVTTNPSLFTFSLLVLTTMPGSSHIGLLTRRFANQCSPAGYPEKHTPRPYRGTNGTNPLSSCQENRVPVHTGNPSPRPLAVLRPPNTHI